MFGLRRCGRKQMGRIVRRYHGRCPLCGGDLAGHGYQEVGSVPREEGDEGQAARLEDASRAGRLRELLLGWEGEGSRDVLVCGVLCCPRNPGLAFSVIISYADMWLEDRVLRTVCLGGAESGALRAELEPSWVAL